MSDLQISVDQASSMKESSHDDCHMDAIPTYPSNPGYITEAAAPVGERNLWGDQKWHVHRNMNYGWDRGTGTNLISRIAIYPLLLTWII